MSKFNNYFSNIVEKLDPVGKEDSDINNDGKVDAVDKFLNDRRNRIADKIAQGKQEEEEAIKSGHDSKHHSALEIWDLLLNKKGYKPTEAIEIINMAKTAFEHLI
jgi:hypothetical protein